MLFRSSIRSSEIGLGDVFARSGYRTGYVGKWHLHRGAFPSESRDFIPEGRARLGFEYWRAYNCHIDFWDGHLNGRDWETERWTGYETDGLLPYAEEFMEAADRRPWFLVVAPHQPHWNWQDTCAPQEYYDRVPSELELPPNVPRHFHDYARADLRHYLAMTLAVDAMLGKLRRMAGRDTLVVFTSDHGTMMGAHAAPGERGNSWGKSRPQEECVRVPFLATWEGRIPPASVREELLTPVDILPSLCGLAGVPVPRSVEGVDLSAAFLGRDPPRVRDAAFLMSLHNYVYSPNLIREDGHEWRGVRTHRHTFVQWRDGTRQLFDLQEDPWQLHNLADRPETRDLQTQLSQRLGRLMEERGDSLHPYSHYRDWLDPERRIVANAFGQLPHPDSTPDWSLLRGDGATP